MLIAEKLPSEVIQLLEYADLFKTGVTVFHGIHGEWWNKAACDMFDLPSCEQLTRVSREKIANKVYPHEIIPFTSFPMIRSAGYHVTDNSGNVKLLIEKVEKIPSTQWFASKLEDVTTFPLTMTDLKVDEGDINVRDIFDQIPSATVVLNSTNKVVAFNRSFITLSGLNPKAIKGENIRNLADIEQSTLQFKKIITNLRNENYSCDFTDEHGKTSHFNITLNTLPHSEGVVIQIADVTQNINQVENYEGLIQRKQKLYETIPIPIIEVDANFVEISSNFAFQDFWKQTDFQNWAETQLIKNNTSKELVSKEYQSFRIRGSSKHFIFHQVPNEITNGLTLAFEDITSINDLTAANSRLEQILSASEAFSEYASFSFKYHGEKFELLSSANIQKLFNTKSKFLSWEELIELDTILDLELFKRELLKAATKTKHEISIRVTDETDKHKNINILFEKLHSGTIIALCHDTTKKDAEIERAARERQQKSIMRFAGGIAHNFNNTIMSILTSAEMMLALPEDAEEFYNDIVITANHSKTVTKNLMDFAKKTNTSEVFKKEFSSLSNLIESKKNLLHAFFTNSHVTLKIETQDDKLPALISEGAFFEIVINFIKNAKEAMEEKNNDACDTVELRVFDHNQTSELHGLNGSIEANTDYVVLSIEDTGIGMTVEEVQHCFDAFFSTKKDNKGNGLGLSSTLEYLDHFGAIVTCNSKKNVGTTFNIFFRTS